ncbi:hypothetical protein EYF80_066586 [Liparis tanakae]|uniref:Uncharacterized protein n=1 Tax=Liparis tanakae TaxID=230148 RepID=A0A4Z2E3E6_9TELE|nr:hypothetical protein EYF80_066586 [Liparis tanakae]
MVSQRTMFCRTHECIIFVTMEVKRGVAPRLITTREPSPRGNHHHEGTITSREPSPRGNHHHEGTITTREPSPRGNHHLEGTITTREPSLRGNHHHEGTITTREPSRETPDMNLTVTRSIHHHEEHDV